jgi:predicted transcriptional regulator
MEDGAIAAIKRLPDAEFEVMKTVWRMEPPVTTLQIIGSLETDKAWKAQTVLTMLLRLTEKGFLKSERVGRERCYTPIIPEQEYLRVETGDFVRRYAGHSIGSLVKALSADSGLSPEDMRELREWLLEKER